MKPSQRSRKKYSIELPALVLSVRWVNPASFISAKKPLLIRTAVMELKDEGRGPLEEALIIPDEVAFRTPRCRLPGSAR